jgi:hypothetical protein
MVVDALKSDKIEQEIEQEMILDNGGQEKFDES